MSETKEEAEMTPDERLTWLRERGVHISTAEERMAGRVKSALQEAEGLEAGEEISYVLVPADTTQPLKELTVRRGATGGGDLLTEHLISAFSNNQSDVDVSLLQEQNALLGSTDAPASVSHESLQKVAAQASVEVFPLVYPSPSNTFTGINIYLDEVGMLKRLRLNTRASKYAELAGFNPPPQFYGDVYLGRVQKLGGRITNQSFVEGIDTTYDAPWLKTAVTENLEHQMEMNRITGRTDATQPSVAGSDGKSKVEEGFSWTQTEEELEVTVSMPEDGSGKDLQIKFRPQALEVRFRQEPLVLLKLFENIDVDSGTWTIDKSATPVKVIISMEKMEQALWPRIRD
ncbi:hypothetical protein FisN_18Hh094 [Fistulifera solaris]|uniref:NudC domain-containing protein 1 n=1 Tax=Fistulifera solaris TaxID=1519565 RepID=A0A1Z5JVE0_FISSO|nr:hypothetical protein FisN_18Hh094 [Fistulifera solaris]|eukprot:GAX17889.1 hypothetical protein FisN_18Hh094 [Fistulifera solaris]